MVQIRCFDIRQLQPGDEETLYARASQERKGRADRYLRGEDRVRCIVADALLRMVPGYEEDALARTQWGKPYLKGSESLHFNLSHSGFWVVIAWGETPVGIDLEELNMDPGKENLARRYFSQEEQAFLFSAPEENRGEKFFTIWTRKESYLKYLGTGINRPLHSVSVVVPPRGVHMNTWVLPHAIMTLCSEETLIQCHQLTRQELMGEK